MKELIHQYGAWIVLALVPFAMALAVVGAIVVVSMILYWRRKEQELAAAVERDIPGPLRGGIVGKGRWVILSRIRGAPRQCRRQLLALE